MSISPISIVHPPNFNQIAGSIGTVPVTNSTNAGGPTPPPPPANQNPPNQVSPTSTSSSNNPNGKLLNTTV